MKICPTCRKTYSDEGLNFCLEDGSVLTMVPPDTGAETLVMNHPRGTDPSAAPTYPGIQTSWDNQANYSMQPKRSSKAWIWVLGIFGMFALLCGGGFVAFLAFVGSMADADNSKASNKSSQPVKTAENTPTPSPFTPGDVQTIDLTDWVKDSSVWGKTELAGDEFVMTSKEKGYYYVLVAPEEYQTEKAVTRLTVRNINNKPSSLGYGLIIHSDVTPLTRDLALLIDTKRKKYRVVRHEPAKESTIIGWTASPAIREGASENVLEARDTGEKIEMYINGQLVNSIKNTPGSRGGVAGLYSGDAVEAGFKKLEIIK